MNERGEKRWGGGGCACVCEREEEGEVCVSVSEAFSLQVRRMSQNCIISLLEAQTKDKGILQTSWTHVQCISYPRPPLSSDVLIGQLLPEMVRCLRRDEQYDLRMDMALVSNTHT